MLTLCGSVSLQLFFFHLCQTLDTLKTCAWTLPAYAHAQNCPTRLTMYHLFSLDPIVDLFTNIKCLQANPSCWGSDFCFLSSKWVSSADTPGAPWPQRPPIPVSKFPHGLSEAKSLVEETLPGNYNLQSDSSKTGPHGPQPARLPHPWEVVLPPACQMRTLFTFGCHLSATAVLARSAAFGFQARFLACVSPPLH
ncbi:hypothetical protein CapIbe_007284 [Capra ibex]